MSQLSKKDLYEWCRIPSSALESHPNLKIPFRLTEDSENMGRLMARELVDEIKLNNSQGKETRAIIPCGPSCWYEPFTNLVNKESVSLQKMVVFHMDECLDWQGRELPKTHPYNFRNSMENQFYNPVESRLAVPEENRVWLTAENIAEVKERIEEEPIDIAYGGWGQDGHVAYNQARRHPFSAIEIDELRNSSVRIQENNMDTMIALAQRTFGTAYQFVPPMSVTLGMKECLSAKKIRLFSDTGAWKQTALRVALFSDVTPEYPMTLLQEHTNALLTATVETATHPVSIHPEWDLGF